MKEGASLLNKSFKAKFFFIIFCMASWQREAFTAMVDNCLLSALRSDCPLWKKENPHNYGEQLLAVYLMVCLFVVPASNHASNRAYLYDTNFM